jgi:hypothetical protein
VSESRFAGAEIFSVAQAFYAWENGNESLASPFMGLETMSVHDRVATTPVPTRSQLRTGWLQKINASNSDSDPALYGRRLTPPVSLPIIVVFERAFEFYDARPLPQAVLTNDQLSNFA